MTSNKDLDSADLRRQIDHDDLQRELSGLDVGRVRRFLPIQLSEEFKRERRRNGQETFMTALQILLLDPAYRQAYAEAKDFLNNEQVLIDEARQRLLEQMSEAETRMAELRANASRLEDGTLVFAGENGEFVDESGNKLSQEQLEHVIWSEATPSWHDYAAAKDRLQALYNEAEEIEAYEQDVVLPALERIDNPENPYDKDELENLQQGIESQRPDSIQKIAEEMHSVKAAPINLANTKSAATEYDLPKSEFEKREVASSFDKARLDIPDLDNVVIPENKPAPE